MPWLILHIDSDEQHCAAIEDALLECSAAAVTLQDSADQPLFDEPDTESARLWQRVQISGMFDAAADMEAVLQQLGSQPGLDIGSHRLEILEDKDWVRSWMDSYEPMPMGDRLWICPSWLQPPEQDAVNLVLDPGMAFGTGTHPTTAMCLRWLDAQNLGGKTVIDFGCGSGILAIAALLLGAESACGTDIDPQAITASHSNAQRNQINEARLRLCLPADMATTDPADIVLANVLAGPLIKLAGAIGAMVKPGGQLVLSGILLEQAGQVSRAYPDFDFAAPGTDDGWVLLTAIRRKQ